MHFYFILYSVGFDLIWFDYKDSDDDDDDNEEEEEEEEDDDSDDEDGPPGLDCAQS